MITSYFNTYRNILILIAGDTWSMFHKTKIKLHIVFFPFSFFVIIDYFHITENLIIDK